MQLKYIGKESTHATGTFCFIPSGILNRFSKLTAQKLSIHSEVVDRIYLVHANALGKAGLAPPRFPKIGYLWRKQAEKVDMENSPFILKW